MILPTIALLEGPGYQLWNGDCVEAMAAMGPASIDAIVTDPPAGIGFMGKAWDTYERRAFVEWMTTVMRQCHRVLKPGGHAVVWALPRTSHWTAWAVEDAGFEVRDVVTHLFGSGFPKSLDVAKAIDRATGAVRTEVVGVKAGHADFVDRTDAHSAGGRSETQKWDGWGTALKPASEHWIVARKPLSGTVASTVLAHGTGALNIDGCRVGTNGGAERGPDDVGERGQPNAVFGSGLDLGNAAPKVDGLGRWPPNVVLSHSVGCEQVGTKQVATGTAYRENGGGLTFGGEVPKPPMPNATHADANGLETVPAFRCEPGCPVAELDRQSGVSVSRGGFTPGSTGTMGAREGRYGAASGEIADRDFTGHGDTGGASRFFPNFEPGFRYEAKAGRAERNAGLHEFAEKPLLWSSGEQSPGTFQAEGTHRAAKNFHPTVKPVDLMRWLVRLVTPPGGTVLDPFVGSGTTLVAAVFEGFDCIGIERDPDYARIAEGRLTQPIQTGLF